MISTKVAPDNTILITELKKGMVLSYILKGDTLKPIGHTIPASHNVIQELNKLMINT